MYCEPNRSTAAGAVSISPMRLLFPIAKLYETGVRLRNGLYSSGLLQVKRLRQPVISVGNLTMGGTGKTPTVIALGQLLQASGCCVSVLLRGYKGRNQDGPLLVSDGKRVLTSSGIAGDEALVIAKNLPGALVVVAKDRAQAGAWVESRFSVGAHLLDDGFQHLKIYRDLNLLLVDVTNPFGGGNVPPAGRLREPLQAISRADAVILTRVQTGHNYQDLIGLVQRYKPGVPCLLARQQFVSAATINPEESFSIGNLIGASALAFAGLGNPFQFFDSLQNWGVRLSYKMSFPDHHRYTHRDLNRIREKCLGRGIDTVVTTEKDAENFQANQLDPLRVVVVKTAFEFEDVEELRRLLRDKMRVLVQ